MALSTQPYKGARDFFPEDKRLQKYLFGVMRSICERYGYEEYDAPMLEPTELYLSKGNEEIIQEQTYTFKDRGDRSVTLRTEMTPSVSRMVAGRRQELAYPVRWYSIPQCWRYERMQRGRGREFYQLNVDIFGISGLSAELEMIQIADGIMKALGAKEEMYTIRLNSRKLMNTLMKDVLKLDDTQAATLGHLIDRMQKMEYPEFIGQIDAIFTPLQREQEEAEQLLEFLKAETLDALPKEFATHESVAELRTLMTMLEASGIKNAVFDPTLMRGFDYYTDFTFEVFDNDPENNRSMFGGGRYDGLVGAFGVEPVPTVGFAMGDITLLNFLETHQLLPVLKTEVELYVVLIGDVYERTVPLLNDLREMGVNVAVDSSERKMDKQIRSAEKMGIENVLFVGEKELEDEQYSLKNLTTGNEERHSVQRLVSIIKDYRKL